MKHDRSQEWMLAILSLFGLLASAACGEEGTPGRPTHSISPFDYTAIDQELGWAHEAGYNSIRVFIQFLVWKQDPDGLKKRLEEFLSIADKDQVRVISFDAQDVVALKKN